MRYRIARLLSTIYRSLYFPPAIIAIAILSATGITWHSASVSRANDKADAINERINTTERSVQDTLNSYEEILQGGVGLYRGSDSVTVDDWTNFLQAFDIKKNFPSAQTIGFMKVVNATDAATFTASMRTQPGLESYTIHPLDPNATVYAPLMYAVAVATKSPIGYGYNGYSDPARKQAMYEARDTGTTALTGLLTFHPTPQTQYKGFGVFVPYYGHQNPPTTVADRQAAISGYVYASFRADLFFGRTTGDTTDRYAGYQVRIGGDTQPLYDSASYATISKEKRATRLTRTLRLYGQDWNIDYAFRPKALLSEAQLRRPTGIAFAGIFCAALIALVVLLLLKARSHELTVQKERAVELAKDELLSLASHQLRTPATGVKQYLGMILQGFAGEVPPTQMQLLDKAYASNDRQLHIINEILHLAKIESGRIVLARQTTDINSLMEDIITEQQPDIQASKHKVQVKLPKRPLILYVDSHTLRMAIENIISNAIKYTPKGGEVTIRVFKTHEHAFIRVKDSGIGIAQADTDKLFKQFSRLPNEMSLSVGGTGIGLYLAKHLVELHGGTITVKSAPGKGSTFTIILPLSD
jgi:signal transduction histidine kinase